MDNTYLNILLQLHDTVESDVIPVQDKEKIIKHIESLEQLLWKYSA